MKKLVLTAIAATALVATAAQAAPFQTKPGVVSQVWPSSGLLVLANGEHYQMLNHAMLLGFAPGDAVIVGYKVQEGQLIGRSLYRVPPTGDSNSVTPSFSRSQRQAT